MVKTLTIEGMSCMHCVKAVTNALNGLEGVVSAAVDLESKTAVLDISGDVADKALIAAVEEEGYTVAGIA